MLAFRKSFPVMLSDMDHTVEDKDNTNSDRSPPSFANSEWDDDGKRKSSKERKQEH